MADPRIAPAEPAEPQAADVVLRLPELVELITSHVGLGDLLAWASTCKRFHAASPGSFRTPVLAFLTDSRVLWIASEASLVPTVKDQRRFCAEAALAGDSDMLFSLRFIGGFCWDEDCCTSAAIGGQPPTWAAASGCIL